MVHILQNPVYGEDYKDGFIFFSYNSASLIDQGIALFESGESLSGQQIAHCGIISGDSKCVEADHPTVQEFDFIQKHVNNPNTVVFLKKPKGLTVDGANIIITEAQRYLGRKYAYIGVAGSAVFMLLTAGWHIFPFLRYWKNPLNPKDQMFCSELVAEAMRKWMRKTGVLKYHPTNIYPTTLYEDQSLWEQWDYGIVDRKREEGKTVTNVQGQ
jgi:hypothetical protein